MACKSCASEKQQYFSGELSVAFLAVEKLQKDPVYVVQNIFVCFYCWFELLVIPPAELRQLKQGG